MELDIALYNLSRGGGVVTSHQLSLQPGTANRKVADVPAAGKLGRKILKTVEMFDKSAATVFLCLFS